MNIHIMYNGKSCIMLSFSDSCFSRFMSQTLTRQKYLILGLWTETLAVIKGWYRESSDRSTIQIQTLHIVLNPKSAGTLRNKYITNTHYSTLKIQSTRIGSKQVQVTDDSLKYNTSNIEFLRVWGQIKVYVSYLVCDPADIVGRITLVR